MDQLADSELAILQQIVNLHTNTLDNILYAVNKILDRVIALEQQVEATS